MIAMQLSRAAAVLAAEHIGIDVAFEGLSTDSRNLVPGNLFVALHGERFDGHDHVEAARSRGATAALISRPVATALPRLLVKDTRQALGHLAAHWRGGFAIPVVGVTGSNGKTTVKEMIARVLGQAGDVLATRGNLNNDIGVPLTLCRLGAEHRAAVIEMGANHAGEIAYLASLAQPRVGVVTNAGPAHLEGFGSVEGVARAKGELFAALAADGVAVINSDDPYAPLWRAMAGHCTVLDFGLERPAAVSARWQPAATGSRLELTTPAGAATVELPLPGRHNVMNALATAAACLAAGSDLARIKAGLEGLQPVPGRLNMLAATGGATLIDDTYNANPASLNAALAVLTARPGAHWLVLGDMAELGADDRALHGAAGRRARSAGVSRLFALGPLASEAAEAFGAGATTYAELEPLLADLRRDLSGDVTVLVKGSRRMGMERVVAALRAAPAVTEGLSH